MDEKDMEVLLGFYGPGTVPEYSKVRYPDDRDSVVFDGSFGWW